jgi:hypothetical protein
VRCCTQRMPAPGGQAGLYIETAAVRCGVA